MRKTALSAYITVCTVLLSACSSGSGVSAYWNDVDPTVNESNYPAQRDRFAEFAMLASTSEDKESCAALDRLMKKLRKDEVSYYVYSEWIEAAFYSIKSPSHDPVLFEHAADLMINDGMMPDQAGRIERLRYYNSLNLSGQKCTLPALEAADDSAPLVPGTQGCTILVVDASCRSCIGALSALSGSPGRHIAICFGSPVMPQVPGWEYCTSPDIESVFDIHAAPFYFTVSKDGIVQTTYSIPPQPSFTTPESL